MDCTQCSVKYKNLLICMGIKVNHVSTTISPTSPLPAPEYSLRYALIYYVVSVLAPYCPMFSENQLHKCQPGHRQSQMSNCITRSNSWTLYPDRSDSLSSNHLRGSSTGSAGVPIPELFSPSKSSFTGSAVFFANKVVCCMVAQMSHQFNITGIRGVS